MGYDFDIVYKPGAANRVADAFSRRLEEEEDRVKEINILSKPYWRDIDLVDEENVQDPTLKKIMEDLKSDPESHGNYTLENGVVGVFQLDTQVTTQIQYDSVGWTFRSFPHLQKDRSVIILDEHEEKRHGLHPRLCSVPTEQISGVFTTRTATTSTYSKNGVGGDKYGFHRQAS